MGTSFSPTRQDVERYRSWRALSMALNHRIIKTIPRRAYDEIGDASRDTGNGRELPIAGMPPGEISDTGGAVSTAWMS